MKTRTRARTAAWLAGVWTGQAIGLGFIAAPAIFAALPRAEAGRVVTAIFAVDATVSLAFGIVMLILTLDAASAAAQRGTSRFSGDAMLALGALFCTLLGHFGLQPAMAAARSGQGLLSFAALHGISSAFFALKVACAGALAWRLTRGLRVVETTS